MSGKLVLRLLLFFFIVACVGTVCLLLFATLVLSKLCVCTSLVLYKLCVSYSSYFLEMLAVSSLLRRCTL